MGTAALAPQQKITMNPWEEKNQFVLSSDNQNMALKWTLVPTALCKLGGQGEV